MSYCELKDIPEHIFHSNRYLEVLNLTGNQFTNIPAGLESAKSLKYLRLNNNNIVNITEQK